MYKDEVQKMNEEKLQKKFDDEKVSTFIQKYFISLESKKSCLNYWSVIRQMLLWMMENNIIGKDLISEIDPEDFMEIESEDLTLYLRQRETNGISPTTLNVEKNIFSSFWEYLIRSKKCSVDYNIVKSVSYRGISCANGLFKKLPSDQQLDDMENRLGKRKDDFLRIRNIAVFYVLKWTGIRESECAGLDLDDVYLDEDIPYINVLGKGHYREMEKQPVFLTESTSRYLKEWLEFRKTVDNIVDVDALFVNRKGKRFNEAGIKHMFRDNGRGVTPHMVRHWYATYLNKTGNIAFAQQQLRHTSMNTTIGNYSNGVIGMKEMLKSL